MKAPFPITYRELWQPAHIRGTQLPPFRGDAHLLTLTGAQKGTTADGVHFTGAADSNINSGAIHNAQAKLAVSLRFKLDQNFGIGSSDQFLWGKYIDGDNRIFLVFQGDGKLHLYHRSGGVQLFNLASDTGFNASQWYHVYFATGQAIAGGAPSDGARLRLDNGAAVTNADATALPIGGDWVSGDQDDPGAGTGFQGVIAGHIFVMTDDVTAAEETDLYKGIPPADATEVYLLDEGRGVTATNRGSSGAGANGVLDTAATWAFGQVRQPVVSLDGINDAAISSAGGCINGGLSLVVVDKLKSTYQGLAGQHRLITGDIDANNRISLFYAVPEDSIVFQAIGGGTSKVVDSNLTPSIDDYGILIATITPTGVVSLYYNGSLVGTPQTGLPAVSAAAAIVYIGRRWDADYYDGSKCLWAGLIEGALTAAQAKTYSRWLRDVMNLPISI